MATVTWLGESGGPESMEWQGLTFKKDEAVTTDNEYVLRKATNNKYFRVDGYEYDKNPEPVQVGSSVVQPLAKPTKAMTDQPSKTDSALQKK